MAWHLDEGGQQLRRGRHSAEDVLGRHVEAAEAGHQLGVLGGRGQRVHVQLGEGEAGVLAVEAVLAVLAVLAPQQLVYGALEAGHSV